MNLRSLEYLVSVAEHEHFGKAARSCRVTQPTLSAQLKKFEEDIGVLLVERTSKQVLLTKEGELIVQKAREILERVQSIREIASGSQNGTSGTLRVGMLPTIAPYLLPQIMPSLRKDLPSHQFYLLEDKTSVLIEQLQRGQLDCAFLATPRHESWMSVHRLYEEPFLLAIPEAHGLAKRRSVRLEEIRDEPILLLDEGHCLRDQTLELCRQIGTGESQHFRATSLETLLHMVSSGAGVTFVPFLASRVVVAGVRCIPISAPTPVRGIAICARKASSRLPSIEKMVQSIAQVSKKVGMKKGRE